MRKPLLWLLAPVLIFNSCKKSSETPAPTKPGVGTEWTYQYKEFNPAGVIKNTFNVIYKIKSEQLLNGLKYYPVTDSANNVVFLLSPQPDGLYQYANSSKQLLCKDPAVLSEKYTSINNGASEEFTVKEVNGTVKVPYEEVKINKYEGFQDGIIKDLIWYNPDFWFVKKEVYVVNTLTGVYHIDRRIELINIKY